MKRFSTSKKRFTNLLTNLIKSKITFYFGLVVLVLVVVSITEGKTLLRYVSDLATGSGPGKNGTSYSAELYTADHYTTSCSTNSSAFIPLNSNNTTYPPPDNPQACDYQYSPLTQGATPLSLNGNGQINLPRIDGGVGIQ